MKQNLHVHRICSAGMLILALALLLVPAAALALPNAQPEPRVILEKAQTSQGHVTVTDHALSAQLNPLTKPGDYAEITVTLWNCGSRQVQLVQTEEIDCGLEDITVSVPKLEIGEQLNPGDRCVLTLIVAWDSDSRLSYPAAQTGTFRLKLKYESGSVSIVPDAPGSLPPDTGDASMLAPWTWLLACSGVGALVCLFLLLRRKEAQ